MIDLAEATLVGTGCRRLVYVHPQDSQRCIKVHTPAAQAEPHRQKALARERYYLRFYERRGRAMTHLSRYFGAVATSVGEGDVFELIRNDDGSISSTLAQRLADGTRTLADCRAELRELADYLQEEGIIVADLHAGNLAWQERGEGRTRLIVIDGVGNTEFLKVNDYLRPFARRKAGRKWNRFLSALEREWGTDVPDAKR